MFQNVADKYELWRGGGETKIWKFEALETPKLSVSDLQQFSRKQSLEIKHFLKVASD